MRQRPPVWQLVLFAELPLFVIGFLFFERLRPHTPVGLSDFTSLRIAGHAVWHGLSPYVAPLPRLLVADRNDVYPFVYPQPFAYLAGPFNILPSSVAGGLFISISIAAIVVSLRLFGVEDWRCYGLAVVGVPVFGGLALGTLGPFLLLGTAYGWRHRDRPIVAGGAFALAAAAKLFLWPLLLWLLLTRRFRAAAVACATLAILAAIWLAFDPSGLRSYPQTLRVLDDLQRSRSYSPLALLLTAGVPLRLAEAVVVAIAVAVLGLLWAVRHSDRSALTAAVLLALVSSPIVWLHYLILLLVPIALANKRISPVWFAPLLLWPALSPQADGVLWKIVLATVVTLAVFQLCTRREPTIVHVSAEVNALG